MGSVQEDATSKTFVLTAQALHKVLPNMGMPNAPFDSHIYSRYTAPDSTRFETALHNPFGGGGVVTYSSGLASFHAIMPLLTPKRIFIGEGYHGVHRGIKLQHRVTGVEKLTLEDLNQLGRGDLLHIETPLNPTGEARNLEYYVAKARQASAYILVDATFASPPLQDPLQYGVDIVMHSGTKYIGGHSDMLCGALVVHQDRKDFEGWLGIRSLRTLHLCVIKQPQTAEKLVSWLHEEAQKSGSLVRKMIDKVQHASLQEADLKGGWLRKQMPGGFGPVFSIWMNKEEHVRRLPSRLYIFHHCDESGGVESLMEWRAMSDEGRDLRLIRVSCGLEDVEDVEGDIRQAFESLLRETSIAYRIDKINVPRD
ncbi:hypothetical protein NCS55_00114800 [Fusarium keratoplasticum]|nr:hypothetical protein NCS55_00114800 [Fusarium keratoplasticum]